MRCRHCHAQWTHDWEYCPECNRNYGGAVCPATQTSEEIEETTALIAIIHRVFAGVQLEGGTTIHEADLEGIGNTQAQMEARAKDPETDWKDVPDWKIAQFPDALSFFDLKGWRFYIPAYMCWTLKNWRTCQSHTANFTIWGFDPNPCTEWAVRRYQTLSDEQAKAVFLFLDFFRKYSGEPEPNQAILAYWDQFQAR